MTSPPKPARTAGQKARANGQTFETRLDWQHEQYRARGAAVHRNGPPVRPVKVGARVLFQTVGVGPPDYTVWADGRCYVFDAKFTEDPAWPLSKLEEHQAKALDAITVASRGRTITGLVVGLSGGARVFWIDWPALSATWWRWFRTPRVGPGEGSLTAEGCARFGWECSGADWLAAVSTLRAAPISG